MKTKFSKICLRPSLSNNIRDLKTVGVISENVHEGIVEMVEPVGVIAGGYSFTRDRSKNGKGDRRWICKCSGWPRQVN